MIINEEKTLPAIFDAMSDVLNALEAKGEVEVIAFAIGFDLYRVLMRSDKEAQDEDAVICFMDLPVFPISLEGYVSCVLEHGQLAEGLQWVQ